MKSIVYAFIAIVLYAIQNTIIDVKLKTNSTISLLLGFYIVLLPLAVGLFFYQKFFGKEAVVIPTGNALWIVASVAVMFFVADFFFIGAYTSGGDVVTVTIILALMPVVGALMKFLWVKEVPTPYHIIGFVCAAAAVTFISIGNSK